MKKLGFVAVAALFALTAQVGTAAADPYDHQGPDWSGPPPGSDPDAYYSRTDRDGYYDRDGHYRHFRHDDADRGDDRGYGPPPPPPPDSRYSYYREGAYEDQCRRQHDQNTAAGTIFGALAGGLIGGAASHGNGGAVVGGVILGGLLGNTIARDIPCEDHRYAFRAYGDGLNGPVGRRYEWRNDRTNDYGYFYPQREYNRGGYTCREFREVTYRDGRKFERGGSACRQNDGNWHFDN